MLNEKEQVKKLSALMKEASESANFRGHSLKSEWHISTTLRSAYNNCEKCDKQVAVNTNPLPNDISIGGEAVALGCDDASAFVKNVVITANITFTVPKTYEFTGREYISFGTFEPVLVGEDSIPVDGAKFIESESFDANELEN